MRSIGFWEEINKLANVDITKKVGPALEIATNFGNKSPNKEIMKSIKPKVEAPKGLFMGLLEEAEEKLDKKASHSECKEDDEECKRKHYRNMIRNRGYRGLNIGHAIPMPPKPTEDSEEETNGGEPDVMPAKVAESLADVKAEINRMINAGKNPAKDSEIESRFISAAKKEHARSNSIWGTVGSAVHGAISGGLLGSTFDMIGRSDVENTIENIAKQTAAEEILSKVPEAMHNNPDLISSYLGTEFPSMKEVDIPIPPTVVEKIRNLIARYPATAKGVMIGTPLFGALGYLGSRVNSKNIPIESLAQEFREYIREKTASNKEESKTKRVARGASYGAGTAGIGVAGLVSDVRRQVKKGIDPVTDAGFIEHVTKGGKTHYFGPNMQDMIRKIKLFDRMSGLDNIDKTMSVLRQMKGYRQAVTGATAKDTIHLMSKRPITTATLLGVAPYMAYRGYKAKKTENTVPGLVKTK